MVFSARMISSNFTPSRSKTSKIGLHCWVLKRLGDTRLQLNRHEEAVRQGSRDGPTPTPVTAGVESAIEQAKVAAGVKVASASDRIADPLFLMTMAQ